MVPEIQLNEASGVPYHEQIVEQLCTGVGADFSNDEGALPSVAELARHLLVSPRTVERAFADLERIGLARPDGCGGWKLTEGAGEALYRWQRDRAREVLTRALHRTEELGVHRCAELAREAEAVRRSIELAQARDLQMSMLPSMPPQRPWLDIAVTMTPASEVGGDYYDFFVGDAGPVRAVIGDATGHGVAAGMMVGMTKASLHAVSEAGLSEAMARANTILRSARGHRLFMALAILELSPRELSVVSAGMPPVLLWRAATGEVEEVLVPGLPLGNAICDSYPKQTLSMSPGDVAVAMSDGLPELENCSGQQLGSRRIRAALAAAGPCSAQHAVDTVQKTAAEWSGSVPAEDDITLMAVRWCETAGKEACDERV